MASWLFFRWSRRDLLIERALNSTAFIAERVHLAFGFEAKNKGRANDLQRLTQLCWRMEDLTIPSVRHRARLQINGIGLCKIAVLDADVVLSQVLNVLVRNDQHMHCRHTRIVCSVKVLVGHGKIPLQPIAFYQQCSGLRIGFFFLGTIADSCAWLSSSPRMWRRTQCAWVSVQPDHPQMASHQPITIEE